MLPCPDHRGSPRADNPTLSATRGPCVQPSLQGCGLRFIAHAQSFPLRQGSREDCGLEPETLSNFPLPHAESPTRGTTLTHLRGSVLNKGKAIGMFHPFVSSSSWIYNQIF